ncbi:possible chaperone protein [Aurantimonas manganoxydans SI85-9A1]|uniref:Possible chaperone protein n=1 Tax=Aurantimonas manganoxydans (strain ATCC BAA-1229 / DSM 21871 / SI85-9A1) TaxID=287752 RepID=Q1YJU7_AURMS|nr:Hsp70 family protein [Aurantimonas manganoxydans]EAS50776.1 possible chaperone protein [Aurantimonas manganoxydans SI85-9A1]
MSEIYGIDFGTTNSLITRISNKRALHLLNHETRPHPSVLWYRGTEVVVGTDARNSLDLDEGGAPPGFVRSPKMHLRQGTPILVDGRSIDPSDAIAEVLRYLVKDASRSREGRDGANVRQAVMTIPVNFGGPERRALRAAASKAGIGVVQFVHEPVAALYAHLRSLDNFAREVARMGDRNMLVFDWGGGTLDLTLCRIQGGTIHQIESLGDNEVGGDRFDERLRNLIRAKHGQARDIDDVVSLEHPGMGAKLLAECEKLKIALSQPGTTTGRIIVRDYLNLPGPERNLVQTITIEEFEDASRQIVNRGLALVNAILEKAGLESQDVALCLATGGMVNMPAIRNALAEYFPGRYNAPANGDRIISEGAAWIAHDALRLRLSKPIEILSADSSGRGTYHTLVPAGTELPMEGQVLSAPNSRLFCTDPTEGVACIEFAKPVAPGRVPSTAPRVTLHSVSVAVDPKANPLIERVTCNLEIDHDYVAKAVLRSLGRKDTQQIEFHDLDFALSLPIDRPDLDDEEDEPLPPASKKPSVGPDLIRVRDVNLAQRTNVALDVKGDNRTDPYWRVVPGDLVDRYKPNHFDTRSDTASPRQREERLFYQPCVHCGRSISVIMADGPIESCLGRVECRTG